MAKLRRHRFGLNLLAYPDRVRYGINPGRVAENRTFKALVDHSAKLDVVIGKGSSGRGGEDQEDNQSRSQQRIAGERPRSGFASFPTCRDLEFNGHNLDRQVRLCC